jgi:hypothetical protein
MTNVVVLAKVAEKVHTGELGAKERAWEQGEKSLAVVF